MFTLKDLIRDGKTAKFKQYRLGNLYYETQEGFVFAIPLQELGESTLLAEERCASLMKWIKRALEEIN